MIKIQRSLRYLVILLSGGVGELLVKFIIFYYLVRKESVVQRNHSLLRSSNSSQKLYFNHFEQFKDYQGFNVDFDLAEVANKRSLTHEIESLIIVMISVSTEGAKNKVFDFLHVL